MLLLTFSTTKVRKSIDICKYLTLICINIVLIYVNTYIPLFPRCCADPLRGKKRIRACAPTLSLCSIAFALLLRSGCRYQLINETPLVRLGVEVLNIFQVEAERHHLLTPAACVCILFANTFFRLLFFHVLIHFLRVVRNF